MAELTQARLKELLHYDPETGVFTRRVTVRSSVGANVGAIAGGLMLSGYVGIGIDNVKYFSHRLAFLYMTGSWPARKMDHKDGCRTNNVWLNLREATDAVNAQNQRKATRTNKVGLLGVSRKRAGFRATIRIGGKQTSLGVFATPELAHSAYVCAKRIHHQGCTL